MIDMYRKEKYADLKEAVASFLPALREVEAQASIPPVVAQKNVLRLPAMEVPADEGAVDDLDIHGMIDLLNQSEHRDHPVFKKIANALIEAEAGRREEQRASKSSDDIVIAERDQWMTVDQAHYVLDEETKIPEVMYHPTQAVLGANDEERPIPYLNEEDLAVPTVRITEISGRFSTVPEVLAVNQIYVALRSEKPFIGLTELAADGVTIVYRAISYQELERSFPEPAKRFLWMFKGDGKNMEFLHKCVTDKESKYYDQRDMVILSRDLKGKGENYKRRKLNESGASVDVLMKHGDQS